MNYKHIMIHLRLFTTHVQDTNNMKTRLRLKVYLNKVEQHQNHIILSLRSLYQEIGWVECLRNSEASRAWGGFNRRDLE